MQFNVSPEKYGEILKTAKSHKRFLTKMKECGFCLDEDKIKKQAMKDILSNKKMQKALKEIDDD